jgi:hypothetical protein
MKKKRFKRHQELTYLYLEDCPRGVYRYGGYDHGGHTGILHGYEDYDEVSGCWSIKVKCKSKGTFYSMLESEFREYHTPKQLDNYPIC